MALPRPSIWYELHLKTCLFVQILDCQPLAKNRKSTGINTTNIDPVSRAIGTFHQQIRATYVFIAAFGFNQLFRPINAIELSASTYNSFPLRRHLSRHLPDHAIMS